MMDDKTLRSLAERFKNASRQYSEKAEDATRKGNHSLASQWLTTANYLMMTAALFAEEALGT
jgi:phage shock protein A